MNETIPPPAPSAGAASASGISNDGGQLYQRLLHHLSDYIYTVIVEQGSAVRTIHGPGCLAVTGYSSEDYDADPSLWIRMVHADDRQAVSQQAAAALQGRLIAPLEHRLSHRDGSIRWVRNTVVLRTDASGCVYAYDGLINDITERKIAEEELLESERRIRRLLQAAVDYIYTVRVHDGAAVETLHGPGCERVTGYQPEDYQREPDLWIKMVPPEERQQVSEQADWALRGETPQPIEHRIIGADGSVRWVRSAMVPHLDASGAVVSYDGLINDITARKEAEALTGQQRQQLLQAEKMATLGILVSGVAHEINNPNNFILLNARIFAKAWNDVAPILQAYYRDHGDFVISGMAFTQAYQQIGELIDGILEGSGRIEKIVKNLKDYARQDRGDLDQSFSINSVIEAAVMIMQPLIRKSTQHFSTHLGRNLPAVRGNFQQLEQVIINLISNACQALSDPRGAIRIDSLVEPHRRRLLVRITDQGLGIAAEDLKHVLDPFFTTKREMGGTGLGLSISYNIIKRHGGELQFESRLGRGTTVCMELPLP